MNLVFDVDDTLYDLMGPFQRVFLEMGYDRMADCFSTFMEFRRIGDALYDDVEQGFISIEDYFSLRIEGAFAVARIPFTKEDSKNFEKKYREYQKEIVMSEDMKELLSKCKERGIKLGIISNGLSKGQWSKIETLGVLQWIPREQVIVSEDILIAKPDVRIFQKAEEQFDLRAEDTYYVGDTYLNDIVGASDAGWKTIWINKRGKTVPEGGLRPDYEVHSDLELKNLFEKISFK